MRIIPRRTVEFGFLEIKAIVNAVFSRNQKYLISQFEKKFSQYLNVKHAAIVPSARTGLSVLLDHLDLQPGDEIILSAFNYHVIVYILLEKGLKPVFVDINSHDYNINPDLINAKINRRTKVIIATHLFGKACAIDAISSICKTNDLLLIEDVAHACGASINGKKVGSFGDFACFSFGTGKNMMTLSGGMMVSNNTQLFRSISHKFKNDIDVNPGFKNFVYYGKSFLEILFTSRIFFILFIYPILFLTNTFNIDPVDKIIGDKNSPKDVQTQSRRCHFYAWQANIGLTQLRRIDNLNDKRCVLAKKYDELLKNIDTIKKPVITNGGDHVFLYYCISSPSIDKLRKYLLRCGIDTKKSAMIDCTKIINDKNKYPETQKAFQSLLELPCCPKHSLQDIAYVARKITAFFHHEKISVNV